MNAEDILFAMDGADLDQVKKAEEKRPSAIRRILPAAASFLLLLGVGFMVFTLANKRGGSDQTGTDNDTAAGVDPQMNYVSGTDNDTAAGLDPQMNYVSVTVPMPVPSEDDEVSYASMIASFNYDGRFYLCSDLIAWRDGLVGDKLIHIKQKVEELAKLKPGEGYDSTDIYALNGYDPGLVVCSVTEDHRIMIFMNPYGHTLWRGSDLFYERLGLTLSSGDDPIARVTYEDQASMLAEGLEKYDETAVYRLDEEYPSELSNFLLALYDADCLLHDGDLMTELHGDGHTQMKMTFEKNDGMRFILYVYDGEYAVLKGFPGVTFKFREPVRVKPLFDLMKERKGGYLGHTEDPRMSFDDCRNDPTFGAYMPGSLPEGYGFNYASALKNYDTEGRHISTKEIEIGFIKETDDGSADITLIYSPKSSLVMEWGSFASEFKDIEYFTEDDIIARTEGGRTEYYAYVTIGNAAVYVAISDGATKAEVFELVSSIGR